MEPRRQRLSQRRKAAERSVIFPGHSGFQQDGVELADLFRPRVALTQPAPVERARPIDTQATIALDTTLARSRRVNRLAVLGVLAAAGMAAAVSPLTFSRTPAAVAGSESETHVAVIPASDLGGNASLASHPVPIDAPVKNAEGPLPAPADAAGVAGAAPKPRVTRNAHRMETTSQPKPNGSATAPQPDRGPSSAETYLWSRAGELGEYDQHWKRFTSPRP